MQLAGFALGSTLLVWCVRKALTNVDVEVLHSADGRLVTAMIAVSVGSMLCAGTAFWLALLPARRTAWWLHQAVNAMATLVNYSPVRLGVPSRFLYHMTVDRMGGWMVGGWVATVGFCTLCALGGMTVGSLVGVGAHSVLAWSAAASIVIGSACALAATEVGLRLVAQLRRVAFIDRKLASSGVMLTTRWSTRAVAATRFVDFAMYAVRAWCAVAILDLPLGTPDVLFLALAGYIMNYNPLGRFGFREATMAFVASRLAGERGMDVGATFAQLALIESAGEALACIPLGSIGASWCGLRILRARRDSR